MLAPMTDMLIPMTDMLVLNYQGPHGGTYSHIARLLILNYKYIISLALLIMRSVTIEI